MKLGVRGKLFAISLSLMLLVGLGTGLYLERALKGWLDARIQAELLSQVQLTRTLVDLGQPARTIAALDPIADRVGESTGARVTIIAASGTVLGDSQLNAAGVARMENHRDRPEVLSALAQGQGVSRRFSSTLQTDMLYVAVPYGGTQRRGIVRVAMPLSEADNAVARLRIVLFIASLVALGLAVLFSGMASQLATRDLRRLVDSARRSVKGEGARRLAVASSDELGRLAGSFNEVVDELEESVVALAGERDYLETILDSLNEGVVALNSEQNVTRVNRAALNLLGYSELPSESALLETLRISALVEGAMVNSQASSETVELELASARHVVAQAAVLRTGGCVVVLRDVTRTRRLETVRRDFVANVSHELRTPVSVICANAETLLDGAMADPERCRSFLEAIDRNANRLARIVADLLDLARIEAGEYGLHLETVPLDTVLRRVATSLEGVAQGKGITVHLNTVGTTAALADTHAVEQVMINLVDNAIKYSSQGGQIRIVTRFNENSIRVEVEDQGRGIAAENRARVFERFYRVDPGRSREMGGTGLGLAIVKHLVDAMGGAVGVEPGSNRGSRFWFTLPRAN